jgi:guanylate kinase
MRKGILMVISGFSGAGKGTLVKRLLAEHEDYVLSVSMTTRKPREGEREGVDYFFTDRETFEKTIEEGGLIEYANYVGNYYGTPKAYVEEQLSKGNNVILEIEIQGARNIKKIYPDSLLLFVTPPSAAELERRLKGRGTETDDVIAGRLSRAAEESLGIDDYDYIVVNDDLDTCVKTVDALVEAARSQPIRMKELIGQLREELEAYRK